MNKLLLANQYIHVPMFPGTHLIPNEKEFNSSDMLVQCFALKVE